MGEESEEGVGKLIAPPFWPRRMTGSAVKHPEERTTALEFQWDSVARLIKYILLNGGGVRGEGEQVERSSVLASADDGKRMEVYLRDGSCMNVPARPCGLELKNLGI